MMFAENQSTHGQASLNCNAQTEVIQEEPRISVIIPTYNSKAYLRRAILSALSQNYLPYEVIVVDDGSTDGTEELIQQEFAGQVIYFFQSNRGPGAARNAGIRLCSGDWIAFLDADDYWLPEKLELQVAEIARKPEVAMVACDVQDCSPDGKVLGESRLPQPFTSKIARSNLKLRCLFLTSGLMIRRDVFQGLGGFREDMNCCEDHDMWVRIAASHEITTVHRYLVKKTALPQGLSSNFDLRLQCGLIVVRMAREVLGRRSWPGAWLDDLTLRQAEAGVFVGLAWLHAGRQERGKAVMSLLRGVAHSPILSFRDFKSAYWLCAQLLRKR